MGVTNGRDLLSGKYPTALIIDAVNTMHFVPIKNPIGDYFFVTINSELYAFDTKGETYKWRPRLAKTFEVLIYFTDHYKPLSHHLKELELIIEKNDLPKLSISLYKVLSILKLREKKEFEAFKIVKLIEELREDKGKDPKRQSQYQDMITYLQDLDIEEIVTPVKRCTNYLDESFMATDPKYMGSVKTAVQLALTENREVNHTPIGPAKGWLKIAIIALLIVIVVFAIYWMYEQGYFNVITNMIPSLDSFSQNNPLSLSPSGEQPLTSTYPTPESAKAAIDRGEITIDKFPPAMQTAIKAVKTPVTP
jgi:hypothetical protein